MVPRCMRATERCAAWAARSVNSVRKRVSSQKCEQCEQRTTHLRYWTWRCRRQGMRPPRSCCSRTKPTQHTQQGCSACARHGRGCLGVTSHRSKRAGACKSKHQATVLTCVKGIHVYPSAGGAVWNQPVRARNALLCLYAHACMHTSSHLVLLRATQPKGASGSPRMQYSAHRGKSLLSSRGIIFVGFATSLYSQRKFQGIIGFGITKPLWPKSMASIEKRGTQGSKGGAGKIKHSLMLLGSATVVMLIFGEARNERKS